MGHPSGGFAQQGIDRCGQILMSFHVGRLPELLLCEEAVAGEHQNGAGAQ